MLFRSFVKKSYNLAKKPPGVCTHRAAILKGNCSDRRRSVPTLLGEWHDGMTVLRPPTMYFLMTVMTQADQLPLARVCCRISVVDRQCQLRSVLQVIDMMDCIGLAISVIFIPANLALIFVELQYFAPNLQPLTPAVEDVRISGDAVLDVLLILLCHAKSK